ncbi:hypothetical protein TNCV_669011 [Trichonephila clavipes]|nr:hypothetical protein TNCV_669011 [Trichonephila clavipes]
MFARVHHNLCERCSLRSNVHVEEQFLQFIKVNTIADTRDIVVHCCVVDIAPVGCALLPTLNDVYPAA